MIHLDIDLSALRVRALPIGDSVGERFDFQTSVRTMHLNGCGTDLYHLMNGILYII